MTTQSFTLSSTNELAQRVCTIKQHSTDCTGFCIGKLGSIHNTVIGTVESVSTGKEKQRVFFFLIMCPKIVCECNHAHPSESNRNDFFTAVTDD